MGTNGDYDTVDVAVIGAGIAGLSAAVYARLSDLSVRVFERHTIPGGLCTSWKRSGYTFDYCIHYFMGSGEKQGFYVIWKDLGVIDTTEFRHIDVFGRYVGSDGTILDLFTDYRRLREHLVALAPEDTGKIGEFCDAIRKAQRFLLSEFSFSLKDLSRLIRSFAALPTVFPGLNGFHLIGQWTEPGGGLPPSAKSGRDVIHMIKKEERRSYGIGSIFWEVHNKKNFLIP